MKSILSPDKVWRRTVENWPLSLTASRQTEPMEDWLTPFGAPVLSECRYRAISTAETITLP